MNICVVDYGLGNIYSLANAFDSRGCPVSVTADKAELAAAAALILPGVGAFGDGLDRLRSEGLDRVIIDRAEAGRPVLGICLGMQLLYEASEEFGEHEGLSLLRGRFVNFREQEGFDQERKVPQIGWNTIRIERETPILEGLLGLDMYFVHSFCVLPPEPSQVLATAEYGGVRFCAVGGAGNVFGCQFHPEKSSRAGMAVIDNFLNLTKELC